MDRIEYMVELGESLSFEDCEKLFHCSKVNMMDGSASWNFELEQSYNDYMAESGLVIY